MPVDIVGKSELSFVLKKDNSFSLQAARAGLTTQTESVPSLLLFSNRCSGLLIACLSSPGDRPGQGGQEAARQGGRLETKDVECTRRLGSPFGVSISMLRLRFLSRLLTWLTSSSSDRTFKNVNGSRWWTQAGSLWPRSASAVRTASWTHKQQQMSSSLRGLRAGAPPAHGGTEPGGHSHPRDYPGGSGLEIRESTGVSSKQVLTDSSTAVSFLQSPGRAELLWTIWRLCVCLRANL